MIETYREGLQTDFTGYMPNATGYQKVPLRSIDLKLYKQEHESMNVESRNLKITSQILLVCGRRV